MKRYVLSVLLLIGILAGLCPIIIAGQGQEVVRRPSDFRAVKVAVTVNFYKPKDVEHHGLVVASETVTAFGFSPGEGDCDIVTPFDVVLRYERWRYRSDVGGTIKVTIGGTTYDGALRPMGVYPLGLDLACIDLISPESGIDPVKFPVQLGTDEGNPVLGDATPLSSDDSGMPLIKENGKLGLMMVGMSLYVTSDGLKQVPLVASNTTLRQFLRAAENIPHSGHRLFLQAENGSALLPQ